MHGKELINTGYFNITVYFIFYRSGKQLDRALSNRTDDIVKTSEERPSIPSANSQKLMWDGLTDFQKIRRKEIQSGSSSMTSVAPTSKRMSNMKGDQLIGVMLEKLRAICPGPEDHPDMVPAGLKETKSAAVVQPNYTMGNCMKSKTVYQ